MPVIDIAYSGQYLRFDAGQCKAAGVAHADAYQSADPFPHAVIDDFLDTTLLRQVLAEFPSIEGKDYFDRAQERLKYQFQPKNLSGPTILNLLAELNSHAFLKFVEAISGIDGLIPDPYFSGGGLHQINTGGHLSVHADFNIHGKMKVERRLNLLIYLNEDWLPEYGGNLELWDREMKGCVRSVAPLMGRAVLFNTSLDSFHGHPDPLSCPPDRARRSIALYYYTAFPEGAANAPKRTTTFQTRPGSEDRTDWAVKVDHLVNDWVPFKMQGLTRKVIRHLGLKA